MELSYIRKIIKLVENSEVDEIEIEEEGKKIRVAKSRPFPANYQIPLPAQYPPAPPAAPAPAAVAPPRDHVGRGVGPVPRGAGVVPPGHAGATSEGRVRRGPSRRGRVDAAS